MKKTGTDPNQEFLFKAILSLQDADECREFFEDLCTPAELQEMSRRMQAAKMLRDGHIYNEIAATTGLSTATISRVNRCLKYSSEGYLKVLEEIEKRDKRRNLYDGV